MAQGNATKRYINTPSTLDDLSDVDTSGVTDAQVLTYDSTAGTWGPEDSAGGGAASESVFYGASYTLSPSPHANYSDNEADRALSTEAQNAWTDTDGYMLTDGIYGDGSQFAASFLGFAVATGTVAVRVDAGSAVSGTTFRIWGMFGGSSIGCPTAIKVEYSDNDSTWTTLEDRTGLTGSATGGQRAWRADFDASGAGSHRYWRVTTTGFSTWTFISEVELI